MNIVPIKTVLGTAPGTVIAAVRGVITAVGQRNTGTTQTTAGPEPWSAQDITLQGSDGSNLLVTLWHKDEIKPEAVGKHLYLISAVVNGRTVGLKTDTQNGTPCLRVSKKAEMTFMEPGSAIAQPEPKPISGPASSPVAGDASGEQPPACRAGTIPGVALAGGLLHAAESAPSPVAAPVPQQAPAAGVGTEAKVDELVSLYDLCLTRVILNVGKGISDNSGFLMSPEGTHASAKAVFDQILQHQTNTFPGQVRSGDNQNSNSNKKGT